MISKCIVFLVAALVLADCCALGNGCVPVAGAPIAWDGLGSAPTSDAQSLEPQLEAQPKKHARAKREIIIGPLDAVTADRDGKARSKDRWEQEQAADRDDEIRLKRKLVICRECAAGEAARTDARARVGGLPPEDR